MIFGIQSYLNLPEFTILKIECHNETQVQFKCSDGILFIDTIGAFSDVKFFMTFEHECIRNDFIYEKCDYKKTDEIILGCYNEYYNQINCDKIMIDDSCKMKEIENNNKINIVYSCLDEREGYRMYVIVKQKITKEWINTNCLCEEFACNFGYKKYRVQGFNREFYACYTPNMINCLENNKNKCSGKDGTNSEKCSKYKCGDYLIEIK